MEEYSKSLKKLNSLNDDEELVVNGKTIGNVYYNLFNHIGGVMNFIRSIPDFMYVGDHDFEKETLQKEELKKIVLNKHFLIKNLTLQQKKKEKNKRYCKLFFKRFKIYGGL